MSLTREREAFLYYLGYLRGFQDVSNQLQDEELLALTALDSEFTTWGSDVSETGKEDARHGFWQIVALLRPDLPIPAEFCPDCNNHDNH